MFFNSEKYYGLYEAFDFSVTRIEMTNEGLYTTAFYTQRFLLYVLSYSLFLIFIYLLILLQ